MTTGGIRPIEPIEPVVPPIPPPIPPKRDDAIKEWESKAKEHMESVQRSEVELQKLSAGLERLSGLPGWFKTILNIIPNVGQAGFGPWGESSLIAKIKPRMQEAETAMETDDFYARLYSQVPILIMGGNITDPEEVLSLLQPPPGMSSIELDEIHDIIGGMVDTLSELPPEMALEAEAITLPELIPPTRIVTEPTTISRLTITEIIKSLTAPDVPPSVMSKDEWADFMVESGQISDKADLESLEFIQSEADRIVAEWQERNNMLAAYREGIAQMPDYELVDWAKELVIQPGLALLEGARFYFEHVSMPLAGAVYKTFIPDIDVAYDRYRKTESTWQALGHAWEEWDAPGQGAAEWILKYMLMEGLVDPLTYAGWGIATRIAKPLGPIGRWVGAVEGGIANTFELPFDLIKAGIRKLPKSVGQQATISMHKAGQYVDKYLTTRYGKAIYQMKLRNRLSGGFYQVISSQL